MLIYHVGTMKSGTTYLQSILQKNKSQLLANGWRYPGKRLNQQHAVYDLVPNSVPWNVPASGKRDGKLASGLAEQINKRADESIVISAEVLSCLDEAGIQQIVKTFGKPDKVVFTIRSLSKVIPSAWQQYIKGGGKLSLDKFVDKMEQDRASLDGMWKIYAYGNQVKQWSKVAPVSSIIVPNTGVKEELGKLFFEALELNSDNINLNIKNTESNLSLGYEISEILRFLNARHKLCDTDRNFFLKQIVFPKLGQIKSSKIKLSETHLALAKKWEDEEKNLLVQSSDVMHGDLGHLDNFEQEHSDGIDQSYMLTISSELINSLIKTRN